MELAAPLLTDTGEGHCTAIRTGVLGCSLSGSTVGRAILWWELCLNSLYESRRALEGEREEGR